MHTTAASLPLESLRLDRLAWRRLVAAAVLSLLLHALLYSGWKLAQRYHFLEHLSLPAWLNPSVRMVEAMTAEAQSGSAAEELERERMVPMTFVEVGPDQATAEAPKEAKYYSTQNSLAANPKTEVESNVPKLDGTQERVMRTATVTRPRPVPLQPALAPPQPLEMERVERAAVAAPAETPKPAYTAGDLVLAKPEPAPRASDGQGFRQRPRRLADVQTGSQGALAQPSTARALVGEKAKQEGGVRRVALSSSLDARATPFGHYDAALVVAVQNRWYYLLASGNFARENIGKVVVEFRLHYDGRITDLKVRENTVNELLSLLCQKAIMDPSPYDKWPSDMRRMVGADYRDVTFTFFYN